MTANPWQLPEGWAWSTVSELASLIQSGFAHGKKDSANGDLLHLRPYNIGLDGEVDLAQTFYVPRTVVKNGDSLLERGDVLFNNTNSVELVGKTAIVRNPLAAAFSNHITLIKTHKDRCEGTWLALALRALWQIGFFAQRCNKWIGQAGYNTSALKNTPIPILPTIEEQRLIVAKIEALFDRTREAKRLRAEANKDGETLKHAAVAAVFEEGRNRGWPTKTIGEMILGKPQYGISRKATEEPEGFPILRMSNIVDGRISFDDLKYIKLPLQKARKYFLSQGDILFNRTNSAELVGKSAVFPGGQETVFASYLIRIVPNPDTSVPEFLVFYMNSLFGREYFQAQLTRAIGQVNINAKKLQAMPVPVPSVQAQREVVAYLKNFVATAQTLTERHAETDAELKLLEQSILDRAFHGDL